RRKDACSVHPGAYGIPSCRWWVRRNTPRSRRSSCRAPVLAPASSLSALGWSSLTVEPIGSATALLATNLSFRWCQMPANSHRGRCRIGCMIWPPSSGTTSDDSLLRDKLGQAVNFHQRGQLDRAETAYRSVLKLDRSCFEAVRGLGLLLHELGCY